MVELAVVEAVQQMDRAGAGGGHAHAHVAGELGVRGRGEGRYLLVAHLDELRFLDLVEGAEQAVYPVTRVAVDLAHAPFVEAAQDELCNVLTHALSLSLDDHVGVATRVRGAHSPDASLSCSATTAAMCARWVSPWGKLPVI